MADHTESLPLEFTYAGCLVWSEIYSNKVQA